MPSRLQVGTVISKKYRCILVHVPKTGGTSVERFFLKLHGLDWQSRSPLLLRANPEPSRGPEFLAHLTAREYVACGHVLAADWDSHFKFAFVRNPWERLVSQYQSRRLDRVCSFREYVLTGLPAQSSYTDAWRHLMPQSDYLNDSDGRSLVNFVGRFENLQTDFDIVCSRLGIADSKLPHSKPSAPKGLRSWLRRGLFGLSSSSGHQYRKLYDPELVDVVSSMYQKDLEAFGYCWLA